MNSLLKKAVDRQPITDEDVIQELYRICCREHGSCNSDCPVYAVNGNQCLGAGRPFDENHGCDCFKDGAKMLRFLRNEG